MVREPFTLAGEHVRIEPLDVRHVSGLAAAAAVDSSIYKWSLVPQGVLEMTRYVQIALSWRDSGTPVPFAIVHQRDGGVIGSTCFWNIERWAWPHEHPDACEIGYTWLAASAIRTGANTEAKLLMLTHAFEVWRVLRVCLHTDVRNERSRNAIERIGGTFEGVLRAHRMAADFTPRDSACYSILLGEWPEVKLRLGKLVVRGGCA
jgi:RimJ/RimL family protein N-acetyltransferase